MSIIFSIHLLDIYNYIFQETHGKETKFIKTVFEDATSALSVPGKVCSVKLFYFKLIKITTFLFIIITLFKI